MPTQRNNWTGPDGLRRAANIGNFTPSPRHPVKLQTSNFEPFMSSGSISNPTVFGGQSRSAELSSKPAIWQAVKTLGSLQITVWGFFLAIIILLVGTLAQDEETIVDVKRDYFNAWVTIVHLDVFFPVTIFPLDERAAVFDSYLPLSNLMLDDNGRVKFVFPFPGGATIGLVLLINLIAAKLTRFHMSAKGSNRLIGAGLCAIGVAITVVVILGSHAEDGLQGEPPFAYETLWELTRGTIWLTTIGIIGWAIAAFPKTILGRSVLIGSACLMGIWSLALVFFPEQFRVPDPGLRIVWQMSKSLIAGGILLAGLTILFGRRGGNVLIHLAIGMMMLGQFIFGDRQIEEQMTLANGETTNMALRLDEIELALIDSSDPNKDRVFAIDQEALITSLGTGTPVKHDDMPVQVFVKKFIENADLAKPEELAKSKEGSSITNPATQGSGTQFVAVNSVKSGGATDKMNMPAAYVELKDKAGSKSLGTFLVALQLNDFSVLTAGRQRDFPENIEIDNKPYQMVLRYRRDYKDYEVKLNKVQRINYSGTEMARDFSSFVTFTSADGRESLEGRIWMNNPMRYRGETFYQKSYSSKEDVGKETTGLQVVANAGWLMPYIACAFAALGMFAHFGDTFTRFAMRFDRDRLANKKPKATTPGSLESFVTNHDSKKKDAKSSRGVQVSTPELSTKDVATNMQARFWDSARQARTGVKGWLLPLIVVVLVGGMFGSYAVPKSYKPDQFNWNAAGDLPMQHEGRIKPLDSVARHVLLTLSGRQSAVVRGGDLQAMQKKLDAAKEASKTNSNETSKASESETKDVEYSATEWLLGVMSQEPWIFEAKVFRIDAKEVLDLFELDPEESGGTLTTYGKVFGQRGRHRYSFAQLEKKLDAFQDQMGKIMAKKKENPGSLKFVDQRFVDLSQKLNLFFQINQAYSTSRLPVPPQDSSNPEAQKKFGQELLAELRIVQQIEAGGPPGMIPPVGKPNAAKPADDESNRWRALRPALFASYAAQAMNMGDAESAKTFLPLIDAFDAIRDNSPTEFNKSIVEFKKVTAEAPAAHGTFEQAAFEAWYNRFGAVNGCIAFYIMAAALTFISMIVLPQGLRRTAFWITAVVFIFHSIAIIDRIIITGRAPVINLYSSAVYIGWGAVLFGLIIELLYPIRIGIAVGSIIGSTSLLVAYGLESQDTMPELQAVLDTQFWLTTHVQCITAGYLATFVAGGISIGAILHRLVKRNELTSSSDSEAAVIQRLLHRISYGTVCFAIFFSLIGTVLGGLWADDSWGRFWGWDPKENGALMIVLWNAIVLHARWDRLVGERGFALLAIGGNIVTAWSWFGTNQLGIGLHSYGFTSGVLMILKYFVLSQLFIIVLGALFTRASYRSQSEEIVEKAISG